MTMNEIITIELIKYIIVNGGSASIVGIWVYINNIMRKRDIDDLRREFENLKIKQKYSESEFSNRFDRLEQKIDDICDVLKKYIDERMGHQQEKNDLKYERKK
jgi:hypothetical protein